MVFNIFLQWKILFTCFHSDNVLDSSQTHNFKTEVLGPNLLELRKDSGEVYCGYVIDMGDKACLCEL
jgi:hypothetical protein